MKIALDGPSAAGKSTTARALAQKLNIIYLDTGAFYRAIGLKAHLENVDFYNENQLDKLIKNTRIEVNSLNQVFLDGKDVSQDIRKHEISSLASEISALKKVRLFMVDLQREIANKHDCVLDGRDIGTFVLPDAEFKFFLKAELDERAKRRWLELHSRGQECDLDKVKEDIKVRDYNDSHREFAPLKKAADAIEIDSTGLTVDEVVEKMLEYIRVKQRG